MKKIKLWHSDGSKRKKKMSLQKIIFHHHFISELTFFVAWFWIELGNWKTNSNLRTVLANTHADLALFWYITTTFHNPIKCLQIKSTPILQFFPLEYPVSIGNMATYGSIMGCECHFMLTLRQDTEVVLKRLPPVSIRLYIITVSSANAEIGFIFLDHFRWTPWVSVIE